MLDIHIIKRDGKFVQVFGCNIGYYYKVTPVLKIAISLKPKFS
jgi:hypothetical protein